MLLRLQKILAQGSSLSRRAAEDAIRQGLVKVNGKVVTTLGTKADPASDTITLSGKVIRLSRRRSYILFNKPLNTIVSKSDPQGRLLIWDRLDEGLKETLNSAGRLDFDSEGLIVLTNDGDVIYKLTHPSCRVWKTYHVKVSGIPLEENLDKLRRGVTLEDGLTEAAKVMLLKRTEKNASLEISIHEGKNRQVRRMFSKIGHPVLKLRRVAIGPIKIGRLKIGEWRFLTNKEVVYLRGIRTS